MTHREADEKRLDYEQRARAWLAWHIVALDRSKRLPPLKSLLGPAKPEQKPRQTWQQQMIIVRQLNAAFGGTVSTREPPHA